MLTHVSMHGLMAVRFWTCCQVCRGMECWLCVGDVLSGVSGNKSLLMCETMRACGAVGWMIQRVDLVD